MEVGELEVRETKEEADGKANARDHKAQTGAVTQGLEGSGQIQGL